MFLLYVNELPTLVNSFLYLFADDNKIFKGIQNVHDKEILQKDLTTIYDWAEKWLMQIHPGKLSHMRIGTEMENPHWEYTVGTMAVKYSNIEKDLGVEVDSQLTFSEHMINKTKKANMMAGWIRRSFHYMNQEIFRLLYKTMVRCHVEYCVPVWSPYLNKDIDLIEEVQIRATKMVPGLSKTSYPERLKALKLPTLVYRRLRGDMLNIYKIIHGRYHKECCPTLHPLERQGRHSLSLYQERSRLEIHRCTFAERSPAIWNTLPEEVVTADDVDKFKSMIDKCWENELVKYHYKEPLSRMRVTRKRKV